VARPPDIFERFSCFSRLLAFGWLTLAGAACGTEPVKAAPVTAAPGFVYRAEKNGRVIFLASSLHRMRQDSHPLPAAYEIAYRQAERLWFEHDPREAENSGTGTEAARKGTMGVGKRVEDLLSEPTRKILRQHLASRRIDPESVRRMRPWYLGLHLMNLDYERQGILLQHGVDSYFSRRAYLDDKPVRGLESASRSVAALEKLSVAEQDRNLADTLRNAANVPQLYASLTAAWRQGSEKDALRILRPVNYASSESWRNVVLARSTAWVEKLDGIRSGKPCMVLVGLDHLIGAEGMVSQLRARGYHVAAVRPPAESRPAAASETAP
jgi:uncharacterized protein YbaP (TraB family)